MATGDDLSLAWDGIDRLTSVVMPDGTAYQLAEWYVQSLRDIATYDADTRSKVLCAAEKLLLELESGDLEAEHAMTDEHKARARYTWGAMAAAASGVTF